jgi:hypothetical protein
MASKFTASEKWNDPWFRRLMPEEKLLFMYLCDICDCAGFIERDDYRFAFETRIPEEKIAPILQGFMNPSGRVANIFVSGRWIWLKNHIKHQKNLPLNPSINCHKGIITRLLEHGDIPEVSSFIIENNVNPSERVPEPLRKGVGKGKGKGKGKGGEYERENGDTPEPNNRFKDAFRKFTESHADCGNVSLDHFVAKLRATGADRMETAGLIGLIEAFATDNDGVEKLKYPPLKALGWHITNTQQEAQKKSAVESEYVMSSRKRPVIS